MINRLFVWCRKYRPLFSPSPSQQDWKGNNPMECIYFPNTFFATSPSSLDLIFICCAFKHIFFKLALQISHCIVINNVLYFDKCILTISKSVPNNSYRSHWGLCYQLIFHRIKLSFRKLIEFDFTFIQIDILVLF